MSFSVLQKKPSHWLYRRSLLFKPHVRLLLEKSLLSGRLSYVQGVKIVFKVGFAMLKYCHHDLVKLPFDKLIHTLRNFSDDAMNRDKLLTLAYSFKMGKVGEELDTDFIIAMGDNFYDHGLIDEEDPMFFESYTEVYTSNSLPKQWYLVLGNHDYEGSVLARLNPALIQRDSRWLCLTSFIVNSGKTHHRLTFFQGWPLTNSIGILDIQDAYAIALTSWVMNFKRLPSRCLETIFCANLTACDCGTGLPLLPIFWCKNCGCNRRGMTTAKAHSEDKEAFIEVSGHKISFDWICDEGSSNPTNITKVAKQSAHFLSVIVNEEQALLLQQNWKRDYKIGTKLACEDRDCPVCKVDRDDLGVALKYKQEDLLRKRMSHANEVVKMLNRFEAMVKSGQSGNAVKRLVKVDGVQVRDALKEYSSVSSLCLQNIVKESLTKCCSMELNLTSTSDLWSIVMEIGHVGHMSWNQSRSFTTRNFLQVQNLTVWMVDVLSEACKVLDDHLYEAAGIRRRLQNES
ncbi:Acid phosphatase, type 5 [Artemisia annua]|uniref:Acid phosphatase, type 5 n=1 Tax=Artemisia annua TaxID=35608 RepID=A0A2U1P614_ARTAN|nr:Acid phosphatase, type 5 [Artemisia annua]